MARVAYIFPTSHHYRAPFHNALRDILNSYNIEYTVIYSDPSEENRKKSDTVDIPWGTKVQRTTINGRLIYQHALLEAIKYDLVIVQQENSLVLNYILNIASMLGIKKLAYFGHGRNFQARNSNSNAERWKRFWATKVDWWFGYTESTRDHIASLGFSDERITVFNNAVDTSAASALIANVTPERLKARRVELDIQDENIGVFVGGLYPDKRLEFLIEAADLIRARVAGFSLLMIGGGTQISIIEELAATRPWIKVMGPRFGADKTELMMLGKLFLMPGLVGLAVVDAAAAGLPTITTSFPYHSPEIAYINNNDNGIIVEDWENVRSYADAVSCLLEDSNRLAKMRVSAERMANNLTIEAMADRFAAGVLRALAN